MKLKNEQEYNDWKAKNADSYGRCCFLFAETWADAMESAIAKGETIRDCADRISHEVDNRPGFGITGFMYGMAVSILSQCWEHGEDLRKWHNLKTQLGTEGEKANAEGGVLNPALLTVETK